MSTFRKLGASGFVALVGCGSVGGSCPNAAPSTCPDVAPTYAEVQPILQHACVLCHVAGGQAPTVPLDTYDAVYARRLASQSQVLACTMPRDGVPLPDDERLALLTWFVCDAPR